MQAASRVPRSMHLPGPAAAWALASRPEILPLDEPSLGLAPLLVGELFAALARIKESGVSNLAAEQNARIALKFCDYACVLENGQIVGKCASQDFDLDEEMMWAYLGIGRR